MTCIIAYTATALTYLIIPDSAAGRFADLMLLTWLYIGYLGLAVWVEEKLRKGAKKNDT